MCKNFVTKGCSKSKTTFLKSLAHANCDTHIVVTSESKFLFTTDYKILPFILKYHKIEDILLWPHLETPQYLKDVLNWLRSQNISFVERPNNSPNCPQVRLIEKYWVFCKKKEYEKRSKDPKV